ncbi:MAG: hypothetical protein LBS84_07605 [Clostridiales bacterium]|jgi:hypothetical protein|nr:hypothetical protein [Clostridiales bacterium]
MDKLRYYITIVACLIVTAVGIIQNTALYELSRGLIITMAMFYIIGSLLENYLKKSVFSNDNTDDTEMLTQDSKNEGQNL